MDQGGIKPLNFKLGLLSQYFCHWHPNSTGKDTADFKGKRTKAKSGMELENSALEMELEKEKEEGNGKSIGIA